MIYIILDESFEWGDEYDDGPVIVYVGTDLDKAIDYFHKNFDDYKTFSNEFWNYEASLYGFEDGWKRRYDLPMTENKILTVNNEKDE